MLPDMASYQVTIQRERVGADRTSVEDSLDQLIAPVVGNVVPKLVLRDVDIVGPLGVLPHARDVLLDIANTTDSFLGILHVVAKPHALQLLLVDEVVVLHTFFIFKFEFLITKMTMLGTHDRDKTNHKSIKDTSDSAQQQPRTDEPSGPVLSSSRG